MITGVKSGTIHLLSLFFLKYPGSLRPSKSDAELCFNVRLHGNRNSQIASILDQKNYVEELNRQLK